MALNLNSPPPDDAVATPFVIEELTGKQRVVTLTGRALPHDPFTLQGSMRCDQTYYPGNPIATTQVMGSQEDETSISGYWKDKFLAPYADPQQEYYFGYTPSVEVAWDGWVDHPEDVMAICKLFDDIRRQGQLLRVTWDEIARRGILTKFKQTWHRRHDCEWEMTFAWQDQGEQPAAIKSEYSLADTHAQMVDAWRQIDADVQQAQGYLAMANDYITDVRQKIAQIETAITNVADLASKVVDTTMSGVDAARRLGAILEFARATAQDTIEYISQRTAQSSLASAAPGGPVVPIVSQGIQRRVFNPQPILPGPVAGPVVTLSRAAASSGSLSSSVTAATSDTASTIIAAEAAQRRMLTHARTLRDLAAERQIAHLAAADPTDILRAYIARAGQDLRDVSRRFYNTPDEWRSIMVLNRLGGSKLLAGQLIFVAKNPPRSAAA